MPNIAISKCSRLTLASFNGTQHLTFQSTFPPPPKYAQFEHANIIGGGGGEMQGTNQNFLSFRSINQAYTI